MHLNPVAFIYTDENKSEKDHVITLKYCAKQKGRKNTQHLVNRPFQFHGKSIYIYLIYDPVGINSSLHLSTLCQLGV